VKQEHYWGDSYCHDTLALMPESLFIFFQKTLPKQLLTELAGAFARRPGGAFLQWVMAWFVRRYAVNMAEAANPDLNSYPTFNAFFTRPLKDGVRPVASDAWVSPVDGVVSQAGAIKAGQIFQAKGHEYSTTALVGGDVQLAQQFSNGQFATIYLSPKDYHRIHMPHDGVLRQIIYVPGELYSVNPTTVSAIPGLFARNERVVLVFDNPALRDQPFVMVLVGATIVGSISTCFTGVVNAQRPTVRQPVNFPLPHSDQNDSALHVKKGQDIAQFLLGSTVILLTAAQANLNLSQLSPGQPLRCAASLQRPL
jgi:phosphatidylserine decarboxylase